MNERGAPIVEPFPVGSNRGDDELLRGSRREPQPNSTWVVLATMVIGLPLAVALAVLASGRWYPVLDLAMTELRVRDVATRQTPLVGLPGRIGEFPDQGSHPGPLSFYLWAGPYRLFGASAWALQMASAVVNLLAVLVALIIGARRGGRVGVAVVAGVLALLVRGFGVELFIQPWNPYAPLLWWFVVLLATWSVLLGDHRLLVLLVAVATLCVQTHVPYLLLGVSMVVLATIAVVVNLRNAGSIARGPLISSLTTSAAVGVALWIPPVVDQIRRSPGNVRMLIEHFTSPDEDPIGLWAGFQLAMRHLDPVDGVLRMFTDPAAFVTASADPGRRVWLGAVVLLVWLGAAALAWWMRHGPLVRLHIVVGLAFVVGAFNMSRIFGKVWFYLTLWAWVTATVLFVAVAWTLLVALRDRMPPGGPGRALRLGAEALAVVVATAAVVAATVGAADTDPPEAHLSETLGAVLAPTVQALETRDGAADGGDADEARYLVTWTDAYFFGSQGYGLVNELERLGFDARVLDAWRVPVTPHRVTDPADADVGVHLATGIFVDQWRARDDATQVASVEPRTPAELDEYAALRRDVLDELQSDGLDDLVELVDSNLFLVSNDERVSPTAADAMAKMLVLGQETAVFLVPPGAAP
ncbi:MAG: hypothetical protein WD225_01865 [Ilumatobacteraceae bacterium]